MLQAINILGGMYATPSKSSSSLTPNTPVTPGPTSTASRTRSPYFRKRKLHHDDSSDNELVVHTHTPRRSNRLKSRTVLPPTPESLPRRTEVDREPVYTPTKSSGVPIHGRQRQRKKRAKLDSLSGSKVESEVKTVLGRKETGKVEHVGKIHLIQGVSDSRC